jgi:hypothetical protein
MKYFKLAITNLFILFFINTYAQSYIKDSIYISNLIDSNFYKNISEEINIKRIDSAIYLSENKSYNTLLVKTLLAKEKVFLKQDRIDSASVYATKALKLSKTNKLELSKANALLELGYIFQKKRELKKATESALEALIIYEKKKYSQGIADAYLLMGVLKAILGEHSVGVDYLKNALKIHQQLNDKEKIIKDLINIGTIYFFSDQLVNAKKYFIKALKITPKGDHTNLSYIHMNIATIYQHQKILDSAYLYQIKAIKEAKKQKNNYLLTTLYYNASTVKFQQKDIDSTYYYANKGLQLAKKQKLFNRQVSNLLMISQVDSVNKNTKAELVIFKKIMILKDSILKQERKSIANEMETKYRNLKKDEIIKLQKRNLNVAKDKNSLLLLIIIISIILLAITLLFLNTFRKLNLKNKKIYQIEKKQMKKEIKDKEKELLSIALQVEQKNKLINHFYQKIKNQKLSEEKKNFDSLLSEIKTSLNIQKDIDLFTEKFTELHHNFIGKVKTQFPKLTFKEIKLLSFLKIGLSTKQIASMQNITPAAIHKMRYRIKKKINLDKKSSLDDFIVNL